MPELQPIPRQPEQDLTTATMESFGEQLKLAHALSVVKQSFFEAETFRSANYEWRWTRNDALYLGVVPQKLWKGTSIPRASVSYSLVADQVEAALPLILQALFPQPEWFQVNPQGETTVEEALQLRDHLLYQLQNSGGKAKSFRQEVEQMVKDVLIKGNGYITIERNPKTRLMDVFYRDIRDIYIDPGCTDPSVDKARYVILRDLKTLDEVASWRGSEDMRVPTDEQLYGLAHAISIRRAETMKQRQAAMQGQSLAPALETRMPDPRGDKLEILTYWSPKHTIMTIGTEWVLYTEENELGFYPIESAAGIIINGQHSALGIADRQADLQGTIEGLLNGHLDEISLALNPPRAQNSNAATGPASRSLHPGQVIETRDVKKDIAFFPPSGITQNVFQSIDFLGRLSDKRTGFDAATGSFKPGNANRTLGGMQMQAQGGAMRLGLFVSHIEEALARLLVKMAKMTALTLGEDVILPARQSEGKNYLVRSSVLSKPVEFTIEAASQMLTRERLMNAVQPVLQYLTAPNFQQGLAEADQTLNWPELFRFVQEAFGTAKQFSFVRQLSPEEKQARQQPPPQVIMEQQQQQAELQTRKEIMGMKIQGELQKEQLKKQPDPSEAQLEQMKAALEQQKAQMQVAVMQAKAQTDAQIASMKLEAERVKLDLQRQKAELDAVTAQRKAQADALKTSQDVQLNQIKGEQQLRLGEAQAEQATRHAEESHASKLKMQEAVGKNSKERSD